MSISISNPTTWTYMAMSATVNASASVGLTTTIISQSNSSRMGLILYNNSANSTYVTFGSTSSSSACSIIIPTFAQFVLNGPYTYVGPLSAIRNAGSGTITVTEFFYA